MVDVPIQRDYSVEESSVNEIPDWLYEVVLNLDIYTACRYLQEFDVLHEGINTVRDYNSQPQLTFEQKVASLGTSLTSIITVIDTDIHLQYQTEFWKLMVEGMEISEQEIAVWRKSLDRIRAASTNLQYSNLITYRLMYGTDTGSTAVDLTELYSFLRNLSETRYNEAVGILISHYHPEEVQTTIQDFDTKKDI